MTRKIKKENKSKKAEKYIFNIKITVANFPRIARNCLLPLYFT